MSKYFRWQNVINKIPVVTKLWMRKYGKLNHIPVKDKFILEICLWKLGISIITKIQTVCNVTYTYSSTQSLFGLIYNKIFNIYYQDKNPKWSGSLKA